MSQLVTLLDNRQKRSEAEALSWSPSIASEGTIPPITLRMGEVLVEAVPADDDLADEDCRSVVTDWERYMNYIINFEHGKHSSDVERGKGVSFGTRFQVTTFKKGRIAKPSEDVPAITIFPVGSGHTRED